MAIEDNTNQRGAFAAPGQSAPTQGATAQRPAATGGGARNSFFSMSRVGGISRTAASASLTSATDAIKEAMKSVEVDLTRYEILLLQINNTVATRLRLSAIVLALKDGDNKTVAHRTLLLEGTGELPTDTRQVDGRTVVIDRYAAQVYDEVYATAVNEAMANAHPGCILLNTGGETVNARFDWSKNDLVRNLVTNALLACATHIEVRDPEFQDVVLPELTQDASLQVRLNFESGQLTDYAGNPVRTDITVITTAVANTRQDNASLNNQQESKIVAVVGGFLDLSYTNPQAYGGNQVFAGGVQVEDKRRYRARFIITSMENTQRMTPAAQLMALCSCLVLGEGVTWYRGMKSSMSAGPNDPRDPGALTIETNLYNDPSGFSPKLNTKTVEFSDRDLGLILRQTTFEGLAFSIDVSDAGSDTWYNRPFSQACGSGPDAFEANELIRRAANTLTGGAFGQLYAQASAAIGGKAIPAMLAGEERVLLGYRLDSNGNAVDIRGVDYLWMLNRCAQNPKMVADYSDTIELIEKPIQIRLAERKNIISDQVDQVKFTQLGTRATFNPQFLSLLLEALRVSNSAYRLVAETSGDFLSNRAGGLLNNAALLGANYGAFNHSLGGQPAPQSYRPHQGQSMFAV